MKMEKIKQKPICTVTDEKPSKNKTDDERVDRPLEVTNAIVTKTKGTSYRTLRSQSQMKIIEKTHVSQTKIQKKLVLLPRTTRNSKNLALEDNDAKANPTNENRSVDIISESVSIAAPALKLRNVKRRRNMIVDTDSTGSPSPTNPVKRRRIMVNESDTSEDNGPPVTSTQAKLRRGKMVSGKKKIEGKHLHRPAKETDSSTSTPIRKSNAKRKRNQRNKKSKRSVPDIDPELPEELPKKKRTRRSTVWDHFNEVWKTIENVEEKYAQCKYCSKSYRRSNATSSTGNMNKHIRKTHPEVLGEEATKKFVFSQDTFREALVKWIISSSQPFSVVEEEDFFQLIRTLNPAAELFSDRTVKNDVMAAYLQKVHELKQTLGDVPGKISITMDIWTSKNMLSFLVIRGHWITSDWQIQSELLDFSPINDDHSGANQCRIFLNCLQRFGIPLSKVIAYTMDNATSNNAFIDCMAKRGLRIGLNISSVESQVRCLAHVLNLAVQDMLAAVNVIYTPSNEETDEVFEYDSDEEILDEEDDESEVIESNFESEVVDVDGTNDGGSTSDDEDACETNGTTSTSKNKERTPTAKVRKLMRKIRKSTKLRQKLKQLCQFYSIKPLVPVIDVVTRWNSTYKMMRRAQHLKVALGALCLQAKDLVPLQMKNDEWDEVKCMSTLLQKFDRATQLISMDRHSTFSCYLPILNWLIDEMTRFSEDTSPHLSNVAQQGLLKLQKYQLNVRESVLPFIATFLNPSLKLNYFTEHEYSDVNIHRIKEAITNYFNENYLSRVTAVEKVTEQVKEQSDDLFAHIFKRSSNIDSSDEIEKYLNLPLSSAKVTDILGYWKSQETELPCMCKMARDIFAIQTTSVAVERDNAAGADFVTPNRCSLKDKTIQASMCLKKWFASELII